MATGLSVISKYAKKYSDRKENWNVWPENFVHKRTNKIYKPHNEEEEIFVYDDKIYRHLLLKAGEGAGKSVAGIIKTLNRLRHGCDGIMGSPDFPHFRRSLWHEFVNWCPPQVVIKRHRYRLQDDWEPGGAFELTFITELGARARLMCGGFKEDLMGSWEGPNVSFVFFDEARRHKTPIALKTLDGRVRIPGPNRENPQFFMTSTPRMHWLFDYFGPLQENDPLGGFKARSFTGTISTELNKENLADGYVDDRRNSLNEIEKKILVEGEWAEEENKEKFINIGWWDACRKKINDIHYPCVIALDASKGSESSMPDAFSLVMTSRAKDEPSTVEVRFVETWQPKLGEQFYYKPVENILRKLCKEFPVVEVCYDPYQLHHFAMTLKEEGVAFFKEFTQQSMRLTADKQLLDLILEQKLRHDGNEILRTHIDNCDMKKYPDDHNKIRLVKRYRSLKIDAAVALSMAANRTLYYSAI